MNLKISGTKSVIVPLTIDLQLMIDSHFLDLHSNTCAKLKKPLSILKRTNFPSERNDKIMKCSTQVEGTMRSLVDEWVPYQLETMIFATEYFLSLFSYFVPHFLQLCHQRDWLEGQVITVSTKLDFGHPPIGAHSWRTWQIWGTGFRICKSTWLQWATRCIGCLEQEQQGCNKSFYFYCSSSNRTGNEGELRTQRMALAGGEKVYAQKEQHFPQSNPHMGQEKECSSFHPTFKK